MFERSLGALDKHASLLMLKAKERRVDSGMLSVRGGRVWREKGTCRHRVVTSEYSFILFASLFCYATVERSLHNHYFHFSTLLLNGTLNVFVYRLYPFVIKHHEVLHRLSGPRRVSLRAPGSSIQDCQPSS